MSAPRARPAYFKNANLLMPAAVLVTPPALYVWLIYKDGLRRSLSQPT